MVHRKLVPVISKYQKKGLVSSAPRKTSCHRNPSMVIRKTFSVLWSALAGAQTTDNNSQSEGNKSRFDIIGFVSRTVENRHAQGKPNPSAITYLSGSDNSNSFPESTKRTRTDC